LFEFGDGIAIEDAFMFFPIYRINSFRHFEIAQKGFGCANMPLVALILLDFSFSIFPILLFCLRHTAPPT
jgi:hypothetical protein